MVWLYCLYGATLHSQIPVVWRSAMWQKVSRLTKECYKDAIKDELHWYKIKPKELEECAAGQLHCCAIVQVFANFKEAKHQKLMTQRTVSPLFQNLCGQTGGGATSRFTD